MGRGRDVAVVSVGEIHLWAPVGYFKHDSEIQTRFRRRVGNGSPMTLGASGCSRTNPVSAHGASLIGDQCNLCNPDLNEITVFLVFLATSIALTKTRVSNLGLVTTFANLQCRHMNAMPLQRRQWAPLRSGWRRAPRLPTALSSFSISPTGMADGRLL